MSKKWEWAKRGLKKAKKDPKWPKVQYPKKGEKWPKMAKLAENAYQRCYEGEKMFLGGAQNFFMSSPAENAQPREVLKEWTCNLHLFYCNFRAFEKSNFFVLHFEDLVASPLVV